MRKGWRETTLGEVSNFASGYAFLERYQGALVVFHSSR